MAYDEINAALRQGADDLVDAVRRIEAIKAIRKTKNFEPLAISFKRIRKILEKAGSRGGMEAAGRAAGIVYGGCGTPALRARGGSGERGGAVQAGQCDTARRCSKLRGCVRKWINFLMM